MKLDRSKKISLLIPESLSISQRGIMISIRMNLDINPKVTLAKCKISFSFKKFKEDLIFLHENNFIEWSGYKLAKKSLENKKTNPEVIEAINFMNNLYSRRFSPESGNTKTNLTARIKESGLENVKKVIANRYSVWKDDATMSIHLNPTTIFKASKFSKYLEEVDHTKVGESFINVESIKLKEGDEITSKIVKTFVDKDTYNMKVYNTNGDGERRGNGKKVTRYGKDIKKLIHVQDSNEKFNGVREYLYYYITN